MDEIVMVTAEQGEVWQIRGASFDPPSEVMRLGEDFVLATGKPATSIPSPDLPALGRSGATTFPALVHRVS
jgi:hypothetical protein